ncbi:MAG: membrane lipoprotein lipid attachment site-containing protein [Bacteroidota bacterium]
MKRTLVFLFALVVLAACNEDEPVLQGPIDTGPEISVDSIDLSLVDLNDPGFAENFLIFDFTTDIPGSIWGITREEENGEEVLFSYDASTEDIRFHTPPSDLGINRFEEIAAGPDGSLYLHANSLVFNLVAVYNTSTGDWSTIEVEGGVDGVTVDQVRNTLWVSHSAGVSSFQDDELINTYDETNSVLQPINTGSSTFFNGFAIAVDNSGVVWFANSNDLYTFIDDEWSLHPLSPLSEVYIISGLFPSRSEGVYIKTAFESLYQLNAEGEIRNFNTLDEVTTTTALLSVVDQVSDEGILFSTGGSFLNFYDPADASLTRIDSENSLLPTDARVRGIKVDASGNTWIGGHNVLGILSEDW